LKFVLTRFIIGVPFLNIKWILTNNIVRVGSKIRTSLFSLYHIVPYHGIARTYIVVPHLTDEMCTIYKIKPLWYIMIIYIIILIYARACTTAAAVREEERPRGRVCPGDRHDSSVIIVISSPARRNSDCFTANDDDPEGTDPF